MKILRLIKSLYWLFVNFYTLFIFRVLVFIEGDKKDLRKLWVGGYYAFTIYYLVKEIEEVE